MAFQLFPVRLVPVPVPVECIVSFFEGAAVVYGFITSKPALPECRRSSYLSGTCLAIQDLPWGWETQPPPLVTLIVLDGFFQSSPTAAGPVRRGVPVLPVSTLSCCCILNGSPPPPLSIEFPLDHPPTPYYQRGAESTQLPQVAARARYLLLQS